MENLMKEAFEVQAKRQIESVKQEDDAFVGLEFEYSLLNSNLEQVGETLRDNIVEDINLLLGPVADKELGASQIELRTKPFRFDNVGLERLASSIDNLDAVTRSVAGDKGAKVYALGSNPLVPIDEIVRSSDLKYQEVPGFHNRNKAGRQFLGSKDKIDVSDAAVVSLLNSLQVNVQAECLDDAVDKCNRSFMIGPYVVALAGNATFLDLKDSGYSDLRMDAWLKSHDVRKEKSKEYRIGLPDRYFISIEDYLEDVSSFPFILGDEDHALQIGLGLYWKDARIKFIKDYPIVEFRPVSIQPTMEENFSVMMFYLGRLMYSQRFDEPLMDLKYVKVNREGVMKDGLDADLYFYDFGNSLRMGTARDMIEGELLKAKIGLEMSLGKSNLGGWKDLLRSRLKDGTPAEKFRRKVYLESKDIQFGLKRVMEDM